MDAFPVQKTAYRRKKLQYHVYYAQADQLRTRSVLHVSVKEALDIGKHPLTLVCARKDISNQL